MRLTLHNRTKQHATLHVTPPLRDGRPMMGPMIFVDAGAVETVDGSAREITAVLEDLTRFGATPRAEADRFDARRTAHVPAWSGIVYEVLGDG